MTVTVDELYAAHHTLVERIIRRVLARHQDDVLDVAQSVWADITAAAADSSRWDGIDNQLAWIRKIAEKKALLYRRRAAKRDMESLDQIVEVEEATGTCRRELNSANVPIDPAVMLKRQLEEAVDKLPAKTRETMLAFYYEGKSAADIAADIGVPIGTITMRLSRGRDQVREILLGGSRKCAA